MRCHIRKIERTKTGGASYIDSEFEGASVTVGRASGQVVEITDKEVALEHARIYCASPEELRIEAVSRAAVSVNGSSCSESILAPGDVIKIGRTHLRVVKPARGLDCALEVERASQVTYEAIRDRVYATRLAHARVSKRSISWTLVLCILIVAGLLPISGHLTIAGPATGGWMEAMWSSGPLHGVHGNLSRDCGACHVVPFTRVRNAECVVCHASIEHHADPAEMRVANMESMRCAQCHREHDEPSMLVRRDEALCTDCHTRLAAYDELAYASRVTDFDHGHPEFRVAVPDRAGVIKRVRLDEAGLKESSGLKFSHAEHLQVEGLDVPGTGQVILDCADCHQLRPGNAGFQPLNFEAHCQDCHRLEFDPEQADRQLVHQDLVGVKTQLMEFYARQFLVVSQRSTAPQSRPAGGLRRPGSSSEGEPESILEAAQGKAMRVFRDVLDQRSCVTCHEIVSDGRADEEMLLRAPSMPSSWMPEARFSHDAHRTSECSVCHQATQTDSAEAVMIPAIAVCRDCHGGIDHTRLLPTACADCHRFHIEGHPVMSNTAKRVAP